MSLVFTGWLIDCLAAIFIMIIIGYIISIKFKSKRKLIITLFVLLAIILPTINLNKNLQKEESTQAAKVTPTKTTATKENKQKKYTKTDLENLFDQIVKKSNDSIFDVGYVQQGEVIEVDVQVSKTGWVLLNDADKKKMVSDLGKGFELVIKNSELYTVDSHIYVFFYGVHSNDELANYEDNRVTIIQTKTDNSKAKQGNTVTDDFRSFNGSWTNSTDICGNGYYLDLTFTNKNTANVFLSATMFGTEDVNCSNVRPDSLSEAEMLSFDQNGVGSFIFTDGRDGETVVEATLKLNEDKVTLITKHLNTPEFGDSYFFDNQSIDLMYHSNVNN